MLLAFLIASFILFYMIKWLILPLGISFFLTSHVKHYNQTSKFEDLKSLKTSKAWRPQKPEDLRSLKTSEVFFQDKFFYQLSIHCNIQCNSLLSVILQLILLLIWYLILIRSQYQLNAFCLRTQVHVQKIWPEFIMITRQGLASRFHTLDVVEMRIDFNQSKIAIESVIHTDTK